MPAPTVIGTNSTVATNATDTSISVSHTVPTTGSNRMVIILFVSDSALPTSATFGGSAATLITNGPNARYYSYAYYFANPANGAATAQVNYNSVSGPKMLTVITIQDAKQTSPVDQTSGTGVNGVTSQSQTVTTANANVLGFHNSRVGLNATALTQDASQTEQSNFQDANARWQNTGTKPWNTAGSNSIGISWTTSSDVEQIAFGIAAAAEVAVGTTNMTLLGVT